MTMRLCLLWLLLAPLSGTPSPQPAGDLPIIAATGAFFAISVADIRASAAWYSEKFGLKVVMPLSKTDKTAVTVLEGGGLIVELIQHDSAVPPGKTAPMIKDDVLVHGFFKAGVVVDDFDGTLAALRARQVEIAFGPFSARPNQRANVIVKDNAGNLIQIFGK